MKDTLSRLKSVLYAATAIGALAPASAQAADEILQPRAGGVAPAAPGRPAATPVLRAPRKGAPDTDQTSGVQDIVVTAQKRSQRLMDVPLSVTASTGDQLAKQGVKNVGDLASVVPGLQFTQSVYGSPILTIRGVGFYDEAVGIAPTVSVYTDQIPLPFSRATEGASLDIERVEVLKGPQGTLFGQNSTGGAINYIAAKPTDFFKAGFDGSYGRFNDADLSGFISTPLTSTLKTRVAVRVENRDGWQQSLTRPGDTLGKRKFFTGRWLTDWNPTRAVRLELSINGWRDRSDSQALQYLGYASSTGPTGYTSTVRYPDLAAQIAALRPTPNNAKLADWDAGASFRRNDRFFQSALRADFDIADRLTLTSLTSFSHLIVNSPADADGTPYAIIGVDVDADTKTAAQELRLAGTLGTDHLFRWMIGGNFAHDKISDVEHVTNNGSNSGVGPYRYQFFDNRARQKVDTTSAFGSIDYNIGTGLTLQGSLRYTNYKRVLDGCLADSGNNELATAFGALSNLLTTGNFMVPSPGNQSYVPPGGCVSLSQVTNLPVPVVHRELHQHNLSWRAGASYKVTPDTMIYANVTRGYKAGSFGTVPAVRDDQLEPVTQESVTAYEVGFKSELLGRSLQLTGAGFYYDYKDKQLLGYIDDLIFGSLPGLVSIPKSRVVGGELSLYWKPTRYLTFNVGGTYIKSKVTSDFFTLPPVGQSQVNIRGEAFPNTPKWNVNADGELRVPIDESWQGYIGSNISYHSSAASAFAETPLFLVKGYTILNARIGVEKADHSLRVEAWGRNLTNTFYWNHVDHVLDAITRIAGIPLTYGMSVSARF